MILWSSWCLAARWMHKQAALTSRRRPVSIPLQADLHPAGSKKAHLFVCKCDDVILNSLLLQLLQLFRGSFSVEGLCLHQCCICVKDSPQHYKVFSAYHFQTVKWWSERKFESVFFPQDSWPVTSEGSPAFRSSGITICCSDLTGRYRICPSWLTAIWPQMGDGDTVC